MKEEMTWIKRPDLLPRTLNCLQPGTKLKIKTHLELEDQKTVLIM